MNIYSVEINKQDYRKLEFTSDYDTACRLPVTDQGGLVDWNPPICKFVDIDKPMADFMMLANGNVVFDSHHIDMNFAPEYEDDHSIYTLLNMACFGEVAQIATEQSK